MITNKQKDEKTGTIYDKHPGGYNYAYKSYFDNIITLFRKFYKR